MKRLRAPSHRTNDGHHYSIERTPFSGVLRKVAGRVLNERPKERPKNKTGTIGEMHSAKRRFTEDEVRELRRRYEAGEGIKKLADEKGMAYMAMKYLLQGISYAWVR